MKRASAERMATQDQALPTWAWVDIVVGLMVGGAALGVVGGCIWIGWMLRGLAP